MIPYTKPAGRLIAPLLVIACSTTAACRAPRPEAAGTSAESSTFSACRIALADSSTGKSFDQEIAELQTRAHSADDPIAYLERLGWAYVARARASEDPGDYRLAESVADCIDEHLPGAAEALLLRGHVAHNLHRFAEAESLARRLVKRRGLWFDHALLGDALVELGELEQAAAAYQRMMNQRPGPEAYSRAAYLRWLEGDLEGALEMMRRAVGASGMRDREAAAWQRVRLAHYELQAGRFAESAALLESALALKSGYGPALLMQGRLLLAQGRAAEAVDALQDAVERNPLPETLWTMLEAATAAGRETAAREAHQSLERHGEREDPRTYALYLATTGGDPAKAVKLTSAELGARRDVFTFDAHAWSLHAAGRLEEAYETSRRATAEGTRDARLFLHAGVIAASLGRSEEARSWLRRCEALRFTLLPSEKALLHSHLAPSSS